MAEIYQPFAYTRKKFGRNEWRFVFKNKKGKVCVQDRQQMTRHIRTVASIYIYRRHFSAGYLMDDDPHRE
jgi:hypothetical protein